MVEMGQTLIVQLLDEAERDPTSAPIVLAQVYSELRTLARSYLRAERPDHTLQATALVHEAYLRLMGKGDIQWNSPMHFFAAASEAMRRVLIDHAKARGRLKRGGDRQRSELPDLAIVMPDDPGEFLKLDAAIERLSEIEPKIAQVVRLRYFVGLEIEEITKVIEVSAPTVKRRWQWARAWLYREMSRTDAVS